MTLPNILVQTSKDIQGILDRLGITTQTPFELIPAVLPTIAFERPTPTDVRLCWARQVSVGAAAELSQLGLFNPAGSGKLIHVDTAIVISSGAGGLSIGNRDTTAGTALGTQVGFRDRRITGTPAGQPRSESNAASQVVQRSASSFVAANDPIIVPFDVYLDEGQGIAVASTVVQQTIEAAWFWEEHIRGVEGGP